MSGYLELADGAFIGVRDGLVLGRVSACDVVVNDTKASRRHARLIIEAGVVEIEDMNSSNGTLLNGKPVDRRLIRDGDEVRIGKTVIIYREGTLPGAKSTTRSTSGASVIFDDDDDLLGDDDLLTPPPAKPAPTNVVEFEDEVVEVQQAPAPTHREPEPVRRRQEPVVEVRKSQPAAPGTAKPAAGDDVIGSSQRVLQYSKKASGKNPLGDDVGQMSGGMRLLVVVGVLAIGGGIVYGIVTAMR